MTDSLVLWGGLRWVHARKARGNARKERATTVGKQIGKVKWFDGDRNVGVLTTVAGTDVRFTCPANALSRGQLVTFEMVEGGLSSGKARAEPVTTARLERRRVGGRRADDVSPAD
jgi:cold shock CspA family protein